MCYLVWFNRFVEPAARLPDVIAGKLNVAVPIENGFTDEHFTWRMNFTITGASHDEALKITNYLVRCEL